MCLKRTVGDVVLTCPGNVIPKQLNRGRLLQAPSAQPSYTTGGDLLKYTAILKDKFILTDDYEDKELKTLIKNLSQDLDDLKVDYPVDVMNVENKKVLTLFPLD